MMRLLAFILCFLLVLAASAQTSSTQNQSPAEQRPSTPSTSEALGSTETSAKHVSGERTVVGCITQSGDGYVLRTDDETFPLSTDRDVTPYVGKKVKIVGRWEATGITTTAPVQGSSSSKPDKTSPSHAQQSGPAFGGELRLRIIGTVIGDCDESQK